MSSRCEVVPPAGAGASDTVCAVLVTYHPDEAFPERLKRIVPQVASTIIVDNGSSQQTLDMLYAERAVTVVSNGENLGVARALNIGVERARKSGFEWALLLDQDTVVDEDMVEELISCALSAGPGECFAVVGSRYRDAEGSAIEPLRLAARGQDWQEVESVITSGSLLSLAAHSVVGPFRDEFFIDHVDTEYCFRARKAGYRVAAALKPLMAHTLGAPTAHRLFGSVTWTTNHSADRRYYMTRNNTVMLKEYGTAGRGPWQWKSFIRSLRLCKRILYFEQDKALKIGAVAEGWWDGVRGKLGPRRRGGSSVSTPC